MIEENWTKVKFCRFDAAEVVKKIKLNIKNSAIFIFTEAGAMSNSLTFIMYAANCTGSKLSQCSALSFLIRLSHRFRNISWRKILKKLCTVDVGNITLISKIDFFLMFLKLSFSTPNENNTFFIKYYEN